MTLAFWYGFGNWWGVSFLSLALGVWLWSRAENEDWYPSDTDNRRVWGCLLCGFAVGWFLRGLGA